MNAGVLLTLRLALQKNHNFAANSFLLEKDLLNGGKVHCEATDEILALLDVLVDGEFIEERKDISLLFRGSSNQRIIVLEFLVNCLKHFIHNPPYNSI